MSFFRPNLNGILSEFRENEKEFKDFDESDTKVQYFELFSGNLRNFKFLKFHRILIDYSIFR
jgi:hypothetical protein